MGCMDHVCLRCPHAWIDNKIAIMCPKCGARVTNDFDEPRDDRDPPDRDDDDEPLDGYDDEP